MIAYAQAEEIARNFVDRLNDAILFPLITLASAVALLVFIFGVFEFIAAAGSEEARSTGKRHIIWGIVGLVVMFSAVALLTIAANTFGLGGELQNAQ